MVRIPLAFSLALSASCGPVKPEPTDTGTPEPTDTGTPAWSTEGPYLVVNEVVALPTDGGEDWVELYNAGDEEATGAVCTRLEESFTVAPGEFMVRYPGEDDGDSLDGSDSYAICGPTGATLDQVSWENGQSPEGGAYARLPDAIGAFQTVFGTTLGASNGSAGRCGNGVLEAGEVCDGSDVGVWACTALGFASGQAGCNASCDNVNVSFCEPYASGVVLNEIGDDPDYLELASTSDADRDISGWSVVDRLFETPGRALVFEEGTLVRAGEYPVYDAGDLGFAIDGAGEAVVLRDADGRVVDYQSRLGCRLPDASGSWQVCTETPRAANQP